MYIDTTFPPPDVRLATLEHMLDTLDRPSIEAAVELLIARLDAADGDADLEDDERSGILMIALGVDYDPAEDDSTPEGKPGDPVDAEDDDSDQGIDDEPHDDLYGDREGGSWAEGSQGGANCIADDEGEEDAADRAVRIAYRDRIRRRRCDQVLRNGRPWAWTDGRTYLLRGPGNEVGFGVAADMIA